MTPIRPLAACGLMFAGLASAPAVHAETDGTCTGFIDTLPTTITTQGVWCLRKDLATAITGGAAIVIDTNNVTIDCNGHKIGGQAAGEGTSAIGIRSTDRSSSTVRNCNVRGFQVGTLITGPGGGHLVEDNRFVGITYNGIYLEGDGSLAQRNRVLDTGGSSADLGVSVGIHTIGAVDVVDNTVGNVLANPYNGNGTAYGIFTDANTGGTIVGNRIRGLVPAGGGSTLGISANQPTNLAITGNFLAGPGAIGVTCSGVGPALVKDNLISGFNTPTNGCTDLGNSP